MNNGYKKGVSIVEVGFFTSDTCYKEKNGNLSVPYLFIWRNKWS